MEKEFGLRVSLSLALEHYLSSGALTTCPPAGLSTPTLSLILNLAPANTPPHSRSLSFSSRVRKAFGVEEPLSPPDFRKAVCASLLLSFRAERSVAEETLTASDFRDVARA